MRHLLSAAFVRPRLRPSTSLFLIPGPPAEASSSGRERVEQLTETEMASIVGGGWLSHLDCTKIANTTGKVLQGVGFMNRDGITSGIGNFLRHVRCEF